MGPENSWLKRRWISAKETFEGQGQEQQQPERQGDRQKGFLEAWGEES